MKMVGLDSIYVHSGVAATGVGRGAAGRVHTPPWHFSLGNFCWTTGKREGRKKRETGKEKKENRKREGWKLKMEGGKVTKWGENFFFFFFFAFHFSKTNEICFESTKVGIFYQEKAFHAGKKFRKNDFASSEKKFLLCPCVGTTWMRDESGVARTEENGFCMTTTTSNVGWIGQQGKTIID